MGDFSYGYATSNLQTTITGEPDRNKRFQVTNSQNASNPYYMTNVFLDGFLGNHNPVAVCVTILKSNLATCRTFDLYNLTEQQFPGQFNTGHRLDAGVFKFPVYKVPTGSFIEACLIDLISHATGCTTLMFYGQRYDEVDIDIDSMESEL